MYRFPRARLVQTTGLNSKMLQKFSKNVKIVECHDYIWNHHEKYNQISTNMASIGSVILKIAFEMLEYFEKTGTVLLSKINSRFLSVKRCRYSRFN